jgi:S1-C subfamily serine protease
VPLFAALPAVPLAAVALPIGTSIPDVAAAVLPSVVHINTGRATGSGVIVDELGTILTNHHVVARARILRVTLQDGRAFDAELVGSDERTELAVIRLVDPSGTLSPIRFGDSDVLRIGDTVLAVGSPFGLSGSVSLGIVSGLGRAHGMQIADYQEFIQTDAAINPGNSGGALVNARGELVGINTAIMSRTGSYQGVGFSIPTSLALPILQSLVQHGRVDRGWLGVRIMDATPSSVDYGKLKLGAEVRGVLVQELIEGTPAMAAGLQRGDVILTVDGRLTRTSARLRNTIAHLPVGTTVELEVLRLGQRLSIFVKLGSLSEAPLR